MKPEISIDEARIAELLATVSHEFRGPLASIKGYAATLLRHQERLSPEEQHDFLQAIVAGSERLEHLVHRVLTLAHLERGALPLTMKTFPLRPLLQEVLATYEQRFPRRHFSLVLDEPATSQFLQILADRQRIREVLEEVLENAINYSPEGSPIAIEGSFRAHTAPDREQIPPSWEVELQVRDQGVGIPPEQLSLIFNQFARVDRSLARAVDGLGLGLALCQRIIVLHGGRIWAESLPEKGSTFHIVLPAQSPLNTNVEHEER